MAREVATRTDVQTRLFARLPNFLASPSYGTPSSLNQILAQADQINRVETPGIRKDHYEFTSPAGDARVILLEDNSPEKIPSHTCLVNLAIAARSPDGFEAPRLDIWYVGPHGMLEYFDGTNTGVRITAYEGTKQVSAILDIDLTKQPPVMKQHSHRLEKSEPVTLAGLEQKIVLHGEGRDVLGVTAYDDLTLYGVEGMEGTESCIAFSIMGRNAVGQEKPIPLVIPKRVTVC